MPFASNIEERMRSANHNGFAVSEVPLSEIIRTMDRVHGLDISGYEPSFLVRTIERRLQATGCNSAASYLAGRLLRDPTEAEAFDRSLRVGYSAFFREPLTFALLESQVLPDLVGRSRKTGRAGLRVWSAGCAAGQEVWSVAILLDELAASADRHPAWRIFATDLSEPDLSQARAGVYPAAALGNVRLRHMEACFTRQGDCHAVATRLREHVEFAVYDLLDTATACPPMSIFGDFDLVLCCNVLIYYRPAVRRRIIEKLVGGLAPGGYLVTGEAERRLVTRAGSVHEVASPASVFQANRK
jgi:chemotaxis methyl-accepting protein methylase